MFETDPKGASGGLNRILEAALNYHRRGWRVTPLDGKAAKTPDWANTRFDETEIPSAFARKNVGGVLGNASAGIVDIDLDCVEARSLAPDFLPKTPARFGRPSARLSHSLYRVVAAGIKTERLVDPEYKKPEVSTPGEHQGTIVELRGDGAQTMFPPSVHPDCGETVEWDVEDADPAVVQLDDLRNSVLRLAAASLIMKRWNNGLPRHDATLALTGALLRGGLSPEVTTHLVLAVASAAGDEEPDDRQRAVEDSIKKFNAGEPVAGASKCRELFGERTWQKIFEWLGLSNCGEWEPLDASIINGCRHAAPELPLDGLGDRWASWVAEQAALKSAPRDYVFAPLLVAAAGLIGNARAVSPWDGWEEPSILWGAKLGDPSSGKSPAADPVHSILHELERERVQDHAEQIRRWEQERARAKAVRASWEAALKDELKKDSASDSAGELPSSAIEPDRPRYPHLSTVDTTVEALAYNLAGLPKGLTQVRDELGGWFESFDRYGGGRAKGERAFWTEAYGGRGFKVDRIGHKDAPVFIERLSVSIDGGLQPDRLATLFLSGDDDGLPARFLYFWPDRVPIERPSFEKTSSPALDALRKLRDLPVEPRRVLRLSSAAAERFHEWRIANAELVAKHSGMFQSWVGKLPGVVLRLALVLRYLRWCAEDHDQEPDSLDLDITLAAIQLVNDYFLPMARRVYSDAALPEAERDSAAIARLIVAREIGEKRGERYVINLRKDVQKKGINRIRAANHARAALDELREAGWVRPLAAPTGGRPRGDYEVNPEALKVQTPSPRRGRNRPPSTTWRARKAKF